MSETLCDCKQITPSAWQMVTLRLDQPLKWHSYAVSTTKGDFHRYRLSVYPRSRSTVLNSASLSSEPSFLATPRMLCWIWFHCDTDLISGDI